MSVNSIWRLPNPDTGEYEVHHPETGADQVKGFALQAGLIAATAPAYYAREKLFTPAKTSLTIHPTWVNIGGVGYVLPADKTIDLGSSASWDNSTYTSASTRAGKDFYIYACTPANGTEPAFVISANSTVPTGYTAENSRKIGGFHCLCLNVGTITGHTLSGYVTGDIIPNSAWDLKFRAVSENAGMVWVKGINKWVDIYLPSWQNGGMASVYGGTIVDGVSAVPITGELAAEYYGLVGKQLITRDEFLVAMAGNPQGVNIAGSADPGTTGGHSATNGVRIVSNYGIEDGVGVLWQWGADQYENYPGSTWTAANYYLGGYAWQTKSIQNDDIETSGKGSCGGLLRRVRLGARWDDGAYCGSRAADCYNFSADRHSSISARGVASLRATA